MFFLDFLPENWDYSLVYSLVIPYQVGLEPDFPSLSEEKILYSTFVYHHIR